MDLVPDLQAAFVGGRLLVQTSTGSVLALVHLDDLDHVDALERLDAHDLPDSPVASLNQLDSALERAGWQRSEPWAPGLDGPSAAVVRIADA